MTSQPSKPIRTREEIEANIRIYKAVDGLSILTPEAQRLVTERLALWRAELASAAPPAPESDGSGKADTIAAIISDKARVGPDGRVSNTENLADLILAALSPTPPPVTQDARERFRYMIRQATVEHIGEPDHRRYTVPLAAVHRAFDACSPSPDAAAFRAGVEAGALIITAAQNDPDLRHCDPRSVCARLLKDIRALTPPLSAGTTDDADVRERAACPTTLCERDDGKCCTDMGYCAIQNGEAKRDPEKARQAAGLLRTPDKVQARPGDGPTDEQIAKWKRLADAASAGPWEADDELDRDAVYGHSDEDNSGFHKSKMYGPDGKVLFDSLNSDACLVHEEYDEDGIYAWDDVAKRNFAFIADARTAVPALISALSSERERAEKANRKRREEECDHSETIRLLHNAQSELSRVNGVVERMTEALKDTLASLVASISLLKRGASMKKAAPSNKMFDQMIADYEASVERARTALSPSDPTKGI